MLIKTEKNIFAEESSAYMLFTAYGLEYFGYNDWQRKINIC